MLSFLGKECPKRKHSVKLWMFRADTAFVSAQQSSRHKKNGEMGENIQQQPLRRHLLLNAHGVRKQDVLPRKNKIEGYKKDFFKK